MSLLPPTNLVGTYQNKVSNNNILQVKLTWTASAGDTFDKYYIYKNDVNIGNVPNTDTTVYDEGLSGDVNYISYSITTWKDGVPPAESAPSEYLSNFSLTYEDLISRLRLLLMDNPTDPRMKRWTDEHLNEYLDIALGDVNSTPPLTNYNFETIPQAWRSMVLIRAKYEAYTSRAGLEVAKEFGFGYGGISLTIDRSGKYLAVSTAEWSAYNERVTKAKLANIMGTIAPKGILTSDLPFKIRTYAPRQYRVR